MGNSNETRTQVMDEIESSIDSKTISDINNTCESSQTASNDINMVGVVANGLTIEQENKIKTTCKLVQELNYCAKNKSTQNLAQKLIEAQTSSSDLFTANKTNTELYNKLKVKISQTDLIRAVNAAVQQADASNKITIRNSNLTDVTLKQTNDLFNKVLEGNLMKLAKENGIEQHINANTQKSQKSKGAAKEVTSVAKSWLNTYMIIAIVFIIGLAILLYKLGPGLLDMFVGSKVKLAGAIAGKV